MNIMKQIVLFASHLDAIGLKHEADVLDMIVAGESADEEVAEDFDEYEDEMPGGSKAADDYKKYMHELTEVHPPKKKK